METSGVFGRCFGRFWEVLCIDYLWVYDLLLWNPWECFEMTWDDLGGFGRFVGGIWEAFGVVWEVLL